MNFEEEEEDECRVCRGPAEEGRPLFKPCKCSGSIGLTHQDCLQSWLQVQRGNGCCELCKHKFRFAPQYAPNAPDIMPIIQVIPQIMRRCMIKWLPLLLRCAFCASLWLLVAPLVTAYLYHAWMHRPSVILQRLDWHLVPGDLVSGAVIAACIIISFLSIMSFADFLRVEWQQGARQPRQRNVAQEPEVEPDETNVDNSIWDHFQQEIVAQPRGRGGARPEGWLLALDEESSHEQEEGEEEGEANQVDNNQEAEQQRDVAQDDDEDDEDDESWQEEQEEDDLVDDDDLDVLWHFPMNPPPADNNAPRPRNNNGRPARRVIQQNDPRIDGPFADRDFLDQPPEDPVDMDINIALDELLGVRGPLGGVFRNLMWLLAFNAIYLGFFTFTPRILGTTVISLCMNTTTPAPSMAGNETANAESGALSLWGILKAVVDESDRQNTTIRLPDIAAVTLGYFSCAAVILLFRVFWMIGQKMRLFRADRARTGNQDVEEIREALDEMNRIVHGLGHDLPPMGDEPPGVPVSVAIGVALDAMMAIVKVGVLLFMKMFVLPIVLGVYLDVATISLFGGTLDERKSAAGRDLFSFILLHWVAGITFMLLVTVSVLQLREVTHPELLAQMIRPQEPQPDLLGNLMHETVGTHSKRMVLSLIIYAVLLTMHVYIPIRVLLAHGLGIKLKFWYAIMPQLQVPLELLLFHLSMLSLLERYKNSIGEIQHHWLKYMAGKLGLADCLLPKEVESFRLVGSRSVFEHDRTVDTFWYDLAKMDKGQEEMIQSNLGTLTPPTVTTHNAGETKPNGERVLRFGSEFIRLPVRLPGRALRTRSILLPTKIGRFRLKRDHLARDGPTFQVWEEVPGQLIPRPPEGWDDLGMGGADVQGRWAWGREKKSTIEGGVARRSKFYHKEYSRAKSFGVSVKLFTILTLSWFATTISLGVVMATPLFIGRFLYYILRVPDKWIHDPMGYVVGCMFFFPILRDVVRKVLLVDTPIVNRLANWLRRFHAPPMRKALVLLVTALIWFGVSPFLLGTLYEIFFLKSTACFTAQEPWIDKDDKRTLLLNWATGNVFILVWSHVCRIGLLTRPFWAFVLDGAAPADVGNNNNNNNNAGNAQAAAWIATGDNRLRLTWQGKHGRMQRFWDVWRAVCVDWEWDKVDATTLLHDCAMPVATQLAWTLVCPMVCLGVCVWYQLPSEGLARAVLIRSVLVATCAVQLGRVWHTELHRWFHAVHQTARDDRYLIGQILINYDATPATVQ